MKYFKNFYNIYAVTQRYGETEETFLKKIKSSIEGGATIIQLREKHLMTDEFIRLAQKVKFVCDQLDTKLIINDNVEVAIEVGAFGVHLGQKDLCKDKIAQCKANNLIFGVSVDKLEQVNHALNLGANYLGCGSVFATNTKLDANLVGIENLIEIIKASNIPVIAIGGITYDNLQSLKNIGLDGIALVSLIYDMNLDEVKNNTCKIVKLWNGGI